MILFHFNFMRVGGEICTTEPCYGIFNGEFDTNGAD
jgi:hypothetical protein